MLPLLIFSVPSYLEERGVGESGVRTDDDDDDDNQEAAPLAAGGSIETHQNKSIMLREWL